MITITIALLDISYFYSTWDINTINIIFYYFIRPIISHLLSFIKDIWFTIKINTHHFRLLITLNRSQSLHTVT